MRMGNGNRLGMFLLASDYGSYDTRTIDKTVKAVVTLEFQIEK